MGRFYPNCLLLVGKEEYTNDNDDTDDSFKDNWIQGQTLASINVGNMEFKILVKTLSMKNSFWNFKQWSDSRLSAVIESENRKTGLQFVVKRRAGHIVRIQNPKVEILLNVCIVFISENWKDVSIKNSSWKSMLLHNVYHFSGAFTNAICFRPRIVSYLMYSPRPWGGLFSHTCQIDVLWQTAPFVFLSPSLFAIGFCWPWQKRLFEE